MPGSTESWSTQQLAEFLAVVSSVTSEQTAIRCAIERAAEALEAELAAVVRGGVVEASIGFPANAVPSHQLVELAEASGGAIEVSGVGMCAAVCVPFEGAPPGHLVVARHGSEFSHGEHQLLRGMARVMTLTLRMLGSLEEERTLRKASEHEVKERERAEQELAHQALHDALTDLPNRSLLIDRIEHALEWARRHFSSVAVLFIDIDNFKLVNDSLGHQIGDQLLIEFAARLKTVMRSSDTTARIGGDTVARLGGDEFVVLCEDLGGERDAIRVAERIRAGVGAPFVLDGKELSVTTSVGIATSRANTTPESLIRDADVALYRAKERGRDRFELFDEAMRMRVLKRLRVENDLRRAVERDELELFYQPIVAVPERSIIGVEALVRWNHPERGLVLPAEFVPLAEESGLILTLGDWVMREACRQSVLWQRDHPDWPALRVSVNVSARQLTGEFMETVSTILSESGAEPEGLALEITESVLMGQAESSADVLQSLRRLGVWVVLDDFGTGYSSLSYLQRFPLDSLKLDRSFVSSFGRELSNAKIVAAAIELGRALEMRVVAEGVETEAQLAQLTDLGCDFAQGYHFAPPQRAGAITLLLRDWFAVAA